MGILIGSTCWLTAVGLRLKRAINLGDNVAAKDVDLGLKSCEICWLVLRTQEKTATYLA